MAFWPWKHFEPEEVLSEDGLLLLRRDIFVLDPESLDMLEKFRAEVGPLLVNHAGLTLRGFRSATEHLQLVANGDTANRWSFHLQGRAFDVSSRELEPKELFRLAGSFGWRGVKLYKTWVHVDMRPGTRFVQS